MWSNTSGSGYALAWTNSSDAVFEGTAGTVAINGNPQANTVTFNTDGYLITGGSLTLSGAGGNVTTGSGTDTIASVVQGTVGFNKNGAGTLLFAGANTYSGGTTINAGTLQVGNNNASGWFGSGSIVNNATLAFSRSDYVSVSQAISGTGTLNVNNGVFDMYANSGGAVGSGQTINVAPGASFMFWAPGAASNSSNWVLNSMGQGQTRGHQPGRRRRGRYPHGQYHAGRQQPPRPRRRQYQQHVRHRPDLRQRNALCLRGQQRSLGGTLPE